MYYVLDENNNKIEAYDKQGVLALLEQAIEDGDLQSIAADSAFVDKLKCCVGTGTHHIAFVPQATYNELQANGQLITNAYYFITDDTTAQDLNDQFTQLSEQVNAALGDISSKRNKSEANIEYELSLSNVTASTTIDLSNYLVGKEVSDVVQVGIVFYISIGVDGAWSIPTSMGLCSEGGCASSFKIVNNVPYAFGCRCYIDANKILRFSYLDLWNLSNNTRPTGASIIIEPCITLTFK